MAAMTAKQAKAVAERYAKAVELVEQGKVFRLYGEHDRYVVVNGQGRAYLVDVVSGECSCPDSQYRCSKLDILCKHALAALIVHERQQAGAGGDPQPQAVNPDAACQRCGLTVETDQLYCEPCQRLVDQGLAETLCRRHGCERAATRGAYCALHAPREPEPEPDADLPAAWCQKCGVALESGELCDACAEREMRRIRRDVELAAEFAEERRQKAAAAYQRLFGEPCPW